MKYSEKTLQYYENLKNVGGFDENLKNVGTGIVGSPLCGDVMKLQLFFDDKDIIIDAKHKVFGCVSAIAAMELATTLLKGRSIEEAKQLRNEEVANSLELTTIKRHCSVLAKEAIDSAINDYLSKKNQEGKNMITISEKATVKLKELMLTHGVTCKGIGINVNAGGCSGIQYSLSYEMEENEEKSKIEVNGIAFFFDPNFEMVISGLNIELVENSFGHGFIVENKNQVSCKNCTCKCGS